MNRLFTVFVLFIFVSLPVLSHAKPFVATDWSNSYTVQKLQNKDVSNKKRSSPFIATDYSNSYTVQKLQNKDVSNKECSSPIVATDYSNSYAVQKLSRCI